LATYQSAREHIGHARACSPKRSELSHERNTPRVRLALGHARTQPGAQHSSGMSHRMSCMSRRALRQGTDVNIVHDASDTHWQSLLQRPAFVRTHEAGARGVAGNNCCGPLRELPNGFQSLGRRTSPHSRGPIYDSATTRNSQARMCSSVCTRPFIVSPSSHMART
jgi:hypothetical protein